jgi:hypothetical protein
VREAQINEYKESISTTSRKNLEEAKMSVFSDFISKL